MATSANKVWIRRLAYLFSAGLVAIVFTFSQKNSTDAELAELTRSGLTIDDRGGGARFLIVPTIAHFYAHQELIRKVNPAALVIRDSSAVTKFEKIPALLNISRLTMDRCEKLESLDGIEVLANIEMLETFGCASLTSINALNNLLKLDNLTIMRAPRLKSLHEISGNATLEVITLIECKEINSLDAIKTLPSIKALHIDNCASVSNDLIEDLKSAMPKLRVYYSKFEAEDGVHLESGRNKERPSPK